MTRHDVAHYLIGGGAGVASIAAIVLALHQQPPIVIKHADPVTFGAPRNAWPSLPQNAVITAGEALKAAGPAKATIFCSNDACKALMADIDDALQIAGWTDEEETSVMIGDEVGLLVGPPGPKAEALAREMALATGASVAIVPMSVRGDVGIIIAKPERK